MFGVLYGLSSIALYQLLGAAGVPTFYDKLLQVPILNISVKLLDRVARCACARAVNPARLGQSLAPRRRHVAYMALWTVGVRGDELRRRASAIVIRASGCRSGSGRAGRAAPRACAYLAEPAIDSTATRDPAGPATKPASSARMLANARRRGPPNRAQAALCVRARLPARVRQPACRNADAGGGTRRVSGHADAGGLSDPSAGQQGADPRADASGPAPVRDARAQQGWPGHVLAAGPRAWRQSSGAETATSTPCAGDSAATWPACGLLVQLVRRAGARRAHEQLLPVLERDVAAVGAVRAVLGLVPVDDDHRARQSDFLVKPRRNSTFGVPASNAQFSTLPSGFFTSMWSQTCGLSPLHLRDGALHRHRLVRVELGRKRVVRRQRHAVTARRQRPSPQPQTTTIFVRIGFNLLQSVSPDLLTCDTTRRACRPRGLCA